MILIVNDNHFHLELKYMLIHLFCKWNFYSRRTRKSSELDIKKGG